MLHHRHRHAAIFLFFYPPQSLFPPFLFADTPIFPNPRVLQFSTQATGYSDMYRNPNDGNESNLLKLKSTCLLL